MIGIFPKRKAKIEAQGIIKPAFTSWYNLFRYKFQVVEHTTDKVLAISDLLKIHIMDVSGGDRNFTMPATAAQDLGKWVILARKGTANDLAVLAPAGEKIFNSSAGGRIVSSDAHDYSAVFLFLAAVGQWATPGFGVWDAY